MTKKKYIINLIILITLITATFYYLLKDVNIVVLAKTILGLDPVFILSAMVASVCFVFCEALVFKIIFGALGEKYSLFHLIKFSFIGFYFSSITPSSSGGQPMQIYFMKKNNIDLSSSSLTILVTVVVYQFCMVCYGAVSLIFNFDYLKTIAKPVYIFIVFGFSVNIVLICLILIAIFSDKLIYKISAIALNLLSKVGIIKNKEQAEKFVNNEISKYKQGAVLIKHNKAAIVKAFMVTALQLSFMYSVPYFVYKAFNLSVFSLLSIITMQAVLNIAVSSLPLPGAVGATESVFMIFFKSIFPAGALTTAMLVSRGISYYAMLLISGTVVIIMHIMVNKKKKIPEKV